MKNKKSNNQEMLALGKHASREDVLLRLLGASIKAIPLSYGGYERLDGGLFDFVNQSPEEIADWAKRKKFNIGVNLGYQSHNLFVVTFFSKADYEDFSGSFCGFDNWVSTEGSNYHVWLYLGDCKAETLQTPKYTIQTQGIILAPLSSKPNGDICSWVRRKGKHPSIVSEDEIKKIFPHLITQVKYINQTQNLKIFIKTEEIIQAIVAALNTSWPGRSGLSQLKVYIALCRRADLESIENFRATDRETSLLAGVSKATEKSAKRELLKLEIVYPVKSAGITKHYGLNVNFFPGKKVSSQIANMILPILNNDAFSRNALNPSGAQIYCSLLFSPQRKLMDICRKTGRGYSTVKKAIKILEKEGLVKKENGAWIALPCNKKRLDEIAKTYGVDGRHQKRKATYIRERINFVSFRMKKALAQI